jgi:hypothetical protein
MLDWYLNWFKMIGFSSFQNQALAAFAKLDDVRGTTIVNLENDPMGLSLPTAVLGVDVPTCVARSPNK